MTGTRQASPDSMRVPAAAIEQLVTGRIRQFLADPPAVFAAFRSADVLPPGLAEQQRTLREAERLAQRWPALSGPEQRVILCAAVRCFSITRSMELSFLL